LCKSYRDSTADAAATSRQQNSLPQQFLAQPWVLLKQRQAGFEGTDALFALASVHRFGVRPAWLHRQPDDCTSQTSY
jgi:hypothetical protein